MAILVWTSVFLGLALTADLLWATHRDWRARRAAIRTERTLTAKYALTPRHTGAKS